MISTEIFEECNVSTVIILALVFVLVLLIFVYKTYFTNKKSGCNDFIKPDYKLLGIQRYGNPIEHIKNSEITRKTEDIPNRLIKMSIIEYGKHVGDYIVFKDNTMKVIYKNHVVEIEKDIPLNKEEYEMLQNVEDTLRKQPVNCCPDGEPGLDMLITVEGRSPMYIYGSTMMNESQKAADKFLDLVKEKSKFT